MSATVSGRFGIIAATRSPRPTPCARSACCRRETSARNSCHEVLELRLFSSRKISTSPWPGLQSRFSEKLSLASGKKRAPGILSPSMSVRSPFSPTTPQKSQTSSQKSALCATDQACNARKSASLRPCRRLASARKAVSWHSATRWELGRHNGPDAAPSDRVIEMPIAQHLP